MNVRVLAELAAVVAITAIAPTRASAQTIYPWVTVGATCDGAAIRVHLDGEDDGQHLEVVGFDVYRRTHGACGDETTRINADPIPRVSGQAFSMEVSDPNVSPDVLYYYPVVGVDAQRTTQTSLYTLYWMPGSNDASYAGCGRTLAGIGTLENDSWTWTFHPCPGSCFPPAWVEEWNPALEPFVGTGTALALFGSFGWTVEGFTMVVDSFELRPCTTAVQPLGWSAVKNLFQ